MRAPALALVLLLALASAPMRTAAEDFGAVGRVTKLLSDIASPQLAPGESGLFSFTFNSTYTEPIFNATLNVSVYMFKTIEETIPVDENWPFPYPRIAESSARNRSWSFGTVSPGSRIPRNFTILTVGDPKDMPHGSVFSQATYFLRFWLEFDAFANGSLEHYVMASRGFFTREQWDAATNATNTNPCRPPWCRGDLNLTILGIDGLLPDSTFGVKEPFPAWPFYALIAAAVAFLAFAFLFWVEENPGSFPRIEAWWARTRGRFARTFRRPKRAKP